MANQPVRLDYGFCAAERLGAAAGLDDAALARLQAEFERAMTVVSAQKAAGKLGFMDLPFMGQDGLAPILAEAKRLGEFCENFVVLGIGGSALGATAVDMALGGCLRHAFARPAGAMRLFVADNSDPRMFAALLDNLDPRATAFNVVSKSGSTAETMSQYLAARQMLEQKLGREEALRRLVFTTDPQAGYLRKIIAAGDDIAVLSVPPNVGGRYSVLSAVGLLPLACAGHDVAALLEGAAQMAGRCQSPVLGENPALMLAALAVESFRRGRNIFVMMPYASDLLGLAQWFGQLWAESLGKAKALDGAEVHVGQTPVAAVGATDQHSQLQLYMEGPQDKLICFLTIDDYGRDLTIPALHPELTGLSYLGGQTMSRLIKAEATATAAALARQGRPSLSLRLPRIDANVIGQVFYLLELATVAAGAALGIDPLDQPGVELGKQLTYGLMGRQGFEDQAAQVRAMDAGDRFLI
ncbi:phosphoglucose isomerase (PGI) [Desulfarculus baarsii DSM 2075]|uniref:Glucose-6-phosphate isomerase n=1 Tax=Desulfarculus baarsii (strain ATCC 33931 / DSM 2075 / LMG 7858 / VKM B-1802 / 2st14) TaxID=644282 RepID=E1QL18_DESB2|nr:glucose-6-phosphate isomerase [Desulfarculus baarsii]ADK85283.1 phosphoglucose isomerase (PGI) [Desulfarculus baarsii DSM 2075]